MESTIPRTSDISSPVYSPSAPYEFFELVRQPLPWPQRYKQVHIVLDLRRGIPL